jgi:hypothetical protein
MKKTKIALGVLMVAALLGCNGASASGSTAGGAEAAAPPVNSMAAESSTTKLAPPQESPRLKCLTKCQNELNACLASAGGDEDKKSQCNKKLQSCLAGCPAN